MRFLAADERERALIRICAELALVCTPLPLRRHRPLELHEGVVTALLRRHERAGLVPAALAASELVWVAVTARFQRAEVISTHISTPLAAIGTLP